MITHITGSYIATPGTLVAKLLVAIPVFIFIYFWMKNRPVWRLINKIRGVK